MTNGEPIKDQLYSMMHSLINVFSLVLFTGTHRGFPNSTVHRNRSVRLTLGADMICIWNEGTMHSGAKSRMDKNGDVMADNRFFSYVWPSVDSGSHRS